jgi:signal transduction histidine kinase
MFQWLRSSLYAKLVTVFLLVTLLPMGLIWSVYTSKAKDQIVQENLRQIRNLSKQINTALQEKMQQIRLDLNLAVKYEIFDDIVVEDLDKRIANFLLDKHQHMFYLGDFHVLNMSNKIIASTNSYAERREYENFPRQSFYPLEKSQFSKKKVIVFAEPIFSSFDPKQQIGYLVLEYFGSNLINFTSSDSSSSTFFYNPSLEISYGSKLEFKELKEIQDKEGFVFTDEMVISYQALESDGFKGFYFIQALDRSSVMSFYNEFSRTILFSILLGLILVVVIGSRLVKVFTTPINELSLLAKRVEEEDDYSSRADTNGEDEIAILGKTINKLLDTVETMIAKTKEESEERLRILTQLIYIFNAITQENNQKDVLCVAREKVADFLLESVEITDIEDKAHYQEAIFYHDVHTKTKILCGYIEFEQSERSDLEKQFLNSIATMVGLQIERLHLVKEAHAASEAKSTFISNMSHELRTPLNAILGFSQILNRKQENEKEKKMVTNILTAGQHLLGLINDILDIAKIEAGKIDVHPEKTQAKVLLDEVEVITSKLATEKGLSFTIELDENFEIFSDIKFLKQILVNQLSNAIKFTQTGGVSIKVWSDETKAYFDIIDTGIGISEQNIKKLFHEFTQIENELQSQNKGTGLGLVLSKNLAKELGGDLKGFEYFEPLQLTRSPDQKPKQVVQVKLQYSDKDSNSTTLIRCNGSLQGFHRSHLHQT